MPNNAKKIIIEVYDA